MSLTMPRNYGRFPGPPGERRASCDFCGMDMDMDPYCVHKKILKNKPYGLYIRHALQECKGEWWKKRKNPK